MKVRSFYLGGIQVSVRASEAKPGLVLISFGEETAGMSEAEALEFVRILRAGVKDSRTMTSGSGSAPDRDTPSHPDGEKHSDLIKGAPARRLQVPTAMKKVKAILAAAGWPPVLAEDAARNLEMGAPVLPSDRSEAVADVAGFLGTAARAAGKLDILPVGGRLAGQVLDAVRT